jgi:hypothetical protein
VVDKILGGATQVRKIYYFKLVRFLKSDRFESLKNIVILTYVALPAIIQNTPDKTRIYATLNRVHFISKPRFKCETTRHNNLEWVLMTVLSI